MTRTGTIKSYIKFCAVYIVTAISQIMRIIPIRNNRVVFISHRGGSQYSDSPKYISEFLQKEYKDAFDIVWIVDNLDKFNFLRDRGIRIAKFHSIADFYYSNSCRVYVTNLFGLYPYVIKRKRQLRIETTHGVAYKSLLSNNVGSDSVGFIEKKLAKKKINTCNICLSGNSITSNDVYRKELGYDGKIEEIGLPRNDILFYDNTEYREKINKYCGLEEEYRILLVMPTWKKDETNKGVFEINFDRFKELLEKYYGGKWVIFIRKHHLSNFNLRSVIKKYEHVRDLSDYPDVQELICVGDMLVTDYSSVMWDFALRQKPVLIYTPDLKSYEIERGFIIPPEKWGLVRTESEEELMKALCVYSYEEMCEMSREHTEVFGSTEKGKATRKVGDMIYSFCFNK